MCVWGRWGVRKGRGKIWGEKVECEGGWLDKAREDLLEHMLSSGLRMP